MPHFQVHLADETAPEIDGHPLTPAPDQSVHEAVLDVLHHHAQVLGVPVYATVMEGPGEGHFVLEVSPDGSSRVLEEVPEGAGELGAGLTESEEELGLPVEPVEGAAVAGSSAQVPVAATEGVSQPPVQVPAVSAEDADPAEAAAPAEGAAPAPAPHPEPQPPAAAAPPRPSALASVLAQARARATAATQLPPPPPPLTREVAARIARINALSAAGHLDQAFGEATTLREELTGTAGTEHPHALEARAIEAYLAHLRGDHREATVLALAVARIRCGAGDPRAAEEVARAAAAWQRLDDDRAALVHGRELLHMWDRLSRKGLLPPAYTTLVEQVRRQVEVLAIYA